MNMIKVNFPTGLLILLELIIGYRLFKDPVGFTRMLIVLFGIVLLIIAVFSLLRYYQSKQEGGGDAMSLTVGVVLLIIGGLCAFNSVTIIGLITAAAIIYGVILIISGVYKLNNYFHMQKAGVVVSGMNAASVVVAVVLGLLIALFPKSAAFSIWQVAGIVLIVEAVIDIISIVQTVKNN